MRLLWMGTWRLIRLSIGIVNTRETAAAPVCPSRFALWARTKPAAAYLLSADRLIRKQPVMAF